MKNIRTDLAIEASGPQVKDGANDGITVRERTVEGFKVTETEIAAGKGEATAGRSAGAYYTADLGKLWNGTKENRAAATRAVGALLSELLPSGEGTVLVVGLGNEGITADSVGPQTVKRLVVTHHIKLLNPELYHGLSLGDLAAMVPGVLGQTGVESAALVRAAADRLGPRCVIAVDALAARSLERLATTVQLTSTGISPGSGVCNSREELSQKTLGCPVIAVGVPTVVDAPTLVWELGGEPPADSERFFVTPKESDVMVRVMAGVLAGAINAAVHNEAEDVDEYAPL